MDFKLRYSQYNERSILIEWPSIIDENILNDVLRFKTLVEMNTIKVLVNVISSYNSLLVIYGSTIDNVNDSVLSLKNWYANEEILPHCRRGCLKFLCVMKRNLRSI
ncbi:carboxyltransferase domain-containing protein [Winogradskyella rapida]|uniref:Carboxyltransferase domain-containing protein n=1 Tax=Winogradskyella rapida TaxID=549701 RepID=A0ABW3KQ54_9FLAO